MNTPWERRGCLMQYPFLRLGRHIFTLLFIKRCTLLDFFFFFKLTTRQQILYFFVLSRNKGELLNSVMHIHRFDTMNCRQ